MGHVVLLGDSIFDNERYVPDRPPVIEQLRKALPTGWQATLLAVDGHITADVANQAKKLPADATHRIVSSGGNDALREAAAVDQSVHKVAEALEVMHKVRDRFQKTYHQMIDLLQTTKKPLVVCTVYDAIPGLGPAERVALAGLNEVILREAVAAGLPIIDLRLTCNQACDYSHVSPIEPSHVGGAKIARVIAEITTEHNFGSRQSVIYI